MNLREKASDGGGKDGTWHELSCIGGTTKPKARKPYSNNIPRIPFRFQNSRRKQCFSSLFK